MRTSLSIAGLVFLLTYYKSVSLDLYYKIWYNRNMKNLKLLNKNIFIFLIILILLSSCSRVKNIDESQVSSESETETISNIVKVTFPEGFTVSEIAARLEENGVCSSFDFLKQANNTEYLSEFGINIDNPSDRAFILEGYLFPDTYEFYRNEDAHSVIRRFLRNTFSHIDDGMISRAAELGFTIDEILTVASIINEEAGIPSENRKISSVIYNRLKSPDFPKLQCDCCTFYIKDSVKPYVDEARFEELMNLYNTYRCKGLPAGPIANPGLEEINSALYPDDTDYYFFISDSDLNYYYAHDWDSHIKNCSAAGIN